MSMTHMMKTQISLRNMISEMNRKNIELKRITKTASILLNCGATSNSIPDAIILRCLREQNDDGGWVSIADTMWNSYFLKVLNARRYTVEIERGLHFIQSNINKDGLWGRSKRDMSRIPITGILLHLFPELSSEEKLKALENLWLSEVNSLTYKAAYTLMAFKQNNYLPGSNKLIEKTVAWLVDSQREDGGFAPWKEHPVDSSVYCTAVAGIGLSCYSDIVDQSIWSALYKWLVSNQLKSGIWKYHEIEDGASWGLFCMKNIYPFIQDENESE